MSIARQTDPTTSHQGATSIKRARGKVINIVARFVRQHCQGQSQSLTAEEIAKRVSEIDLDELGRPCCKVDTYRKRVREAQLKNLISESPERKLCSITGQTAAAFYFELGGHDGQ